jgi:hypothetical protein
VTPPHWQTPPAQTPPAPHCAFEVQTHAEAWHAKPVGHAWPQAPQLAGLLVRSTHPDGLWQQVWGAAHALPPLHEHTSTPWFTQTSPTLHAPPLQTHAPLGPQLPLAPPHSASAEHEQSARLIWLALHSSAGVQALLQLPHAEALDPTFASHPSSAPIAAVGRLQLAKPRAQVESQTLLLQSTDATLVAAHARAHAPQFSTSAVVLVSQPFAGLWSQSPKPLAQVGTHAPAVQATDTVFCVAQTFAQAPQLLLLVRRSTSQPFDAMPSQSAKPMLHDAMAQTPVPQVAVALGKEHVMPQLPQFVFVVRVASQPFEYALSQSP